MFFLKTNNKTKPQNYPLTTNRYTVPLLLPKKNRTNTQQKEHLKYWTQWQSLPWKQIKQSMSKLLRCTLLFIAINFKQNIKGIKEKRKKLTNLSLSTYRQTSHMYFNFLCINGIEKLLVSRATSLLREGLKSILKASKIIEEI